MEEMIKEKLALALISFYLGMQTLFRPFRWFLTLLKCSFFWYRQFI
jgi:hypothetical protein